MKTLGITLARGGSKGIPGKNIMNIGGVPLIGRTVRAMRQCSAIDDVLVSTDDAAIAAIAREYGAVVIDRPPELAGDDVSSEAALIHACQTHQAQTGEAHDVMLLAQNTSPFHDPADMEAVIDLMRTDRYNSCIAVTETYRYFWQANQAAQWSMPYQKRGNRQKRQPWYEEAGTLYCVRRALFLETGNLFATPTGAHVIPSWRAHELDEPDDVTMANLLLQLHPDAS
jgi:CMP-N-acetylneuraminic acid synthetase